MSALDFEEITSTRRGFLAGAGAMVVGFSFLGRASTALADDATGIVRVLAAGAQPSATESWLILTEDAITVYSGKVELGTGIRTASPSIAALSPRRVSTDG